MGFRFLHTADWQLGKPFGGFDAETSVRLQDERFRVINRIADHAEAQGVRDIVVAGDVFDQEHPSDRVLRRAADRMAEAKGCRWWLLPGNHDPAGPDSLWGRMTSRFLPDNVVPLVTGDAQTLAQGVVLLPAPWTSKNPGRDLTEGFASIAPDADLRLGVAHGSVQAFGSDPDEAALIPEDRADRSGLAYLALGDWHGLRRAGPRAWYPGTPEADSFTNNLRGQVLLVDTDNPDAPEPLPTGAFTWLSATVEANPEDRDETPLRGLFGEGESLDTLLLDLKLEGTLDLSVKTRWTLFLEEQRARVAALRWNDDALGFFTDSAAFAERHGAGLLKTVADRLDEMAGEGSDDAARALELLDAYARL